MLKNPADGLPIPGMSFMQRSDENSAIPVRRFADVSKKNGKKTPVEFEKLRQLCYI